MRIACHYDRSNRRSRHIAEAMAEGAQRCGDSYEMTESWSPVVGVDVGFAYGWRHPEMFQGYRKTGRSFVYSDLGWWDRKPTGNVLGGYHKVSVNDRDPTAYFRAGHVADRLARFGIDVKPWRLSGRHILVAGMSDKSAATRGLAPYEWERKIIAELGRRTERPIWYRPKPSWLAARPLPGARFSPPSEPLEVALRNCWAVVTLHSNVAVDALAEGIPVYCEQGVGSAISMPSLDMIESPPQPVDRIGFLADIAWCQWSAEEMRSGICWRYLREETPLCA